MKMIDKSKFLKNSAQVLGEIVGMIENLPNLNLKDLQAKDTVLVIVDMVNGFAREGALKSSRVEAIIPPIVQLSQKCDEHGIVKLAFGDSHTQASPEFLAYPEHCIKGSHEAEIVDEIKEAGGYILIPKNSTNGFHEPQFSSWLNENPNIINFIITGDCTDICILQFALTIKTWFNTQNRKSRIIVPVNAVDTYDLGVHDADLMNVAAIYNMMINGVEVVREVV